MSPTRGVEFRRTTLAELDRWLDRAVAKGADPVQARGQIFEGTMAHDPRTRFLIARTDPDSATEPDLVLAARLGIVEVVKERLLVGDDPNQRTCDGASALLEAARNGNDGIVKLLLAAGADAKLSYVSGVSPLLLAAWSGSDDTVRSLLVAGADFRIEELLSAASRQNSSQIVEELIRKGLNVNETPGNDFPPLIAATVARRHENMRILLSHGADVDGRSADGKTALIVATTDNNGFAPADINCVEILLANSANINAEDNLGWTALMGAARYGGSNVVKLLLDKGATANISDHEGNTPLQQSELAGNREIREILIRHGAA